jgi:putative membrane protein insertion efficiency factor
VNVAQHTLRFVVRLYRWVISPAKVFLFGPLGRCRFEPSCSAYALEALATHGAMSGCWLATKRVCRCHPWGGCGYDPVPLPEIRNPNLQLQTKPQSQRESKVAAPRPRAASLLAAPQSVRRPAAGLGAG